METAESTVAARPAGLFRRLFSSFYDALILLALWMLITALWLPVTGGEALSSGHWYYPLYQTTLFIAAYAYFVLSWIRGGQTIGMRAWRLRVRSNDGTPPRLLSASTRFFIAILSWAVLGVGFLWSFFDGQKRTWHDIYSDTVLLHEPKRR